VRVGLLARGPGLGIPGNSRSTAIGSHIDILSTIADAANYRMSDSGPGRRAEIRTCSGDKRGEVCLSDDDCNGTCDHNIYRCSDSERRCKPNGNEFRCKVSEQLCDSVTGAPCTAGDECMNVNSQFTCGSPASDPCVQRHAICDNTKRSCQTDTDCEATCSAYYVDGQSLIPALDNDGGTVYERTFTYSQFGRSGSPGLAVSTAEGYYAPCANPATCATDPAAAVTHVCSWDGNAAVEAALNANLPTLASDQKERRHYASSCDACVPPGVFCEGGTCSLLRSNCSEARCVVTSGVCHVEDGNFVSNGPCRRGAGTTPDMSAADCGLLTSERCRTDSDCGQTPNVRCFHDVAIRCGTCGAASWKARGNVTDTYGIITPTVTELFDLHSNPEEDEQLNCANDQGGGFQSRILGATKRQFQHRLKQWQTSVEGSGSACEPDPASTVQE